jgi:transcriptional regulator with XRE-family HTH domain
MSLGVDNSTMAATERRRDRALTASRAIKNAIGTEVRIARRASGLSLRSAGQSVGMDFSTFAKVERGQLRSVTLDQLALACAAVGLEPSMRAYLRGDAVRDAPQLRVLLRLRSRLPASAPWQTEVPMPFPGDLRALDARTLLNARWIGFEAENPALGSSGDRAPGEAEEARRRTRRLDSGRRRYRAEPACARGAPRDAPRFLSPRHAGGFGDPRTRRAATAGRHRHHLSKAGGGHDSASSRVPRAHIRRRRR